MMKNAKMILPIVAFVFAVVGAFASINAEVTPPEFIVLNEVCTQVPTDCHSTEFTCLAQKPDGSVYIVYDDRVVDEEEATICINVARGHSSELIQIP